MSYKKFEDACALICEICKATTKDEKILLAKLGTDMHNNRNFAKAYTSAVQKEYMIYLRQKDKGTYQQWYFADLDKKLRNEIKQRRNEKEAVLLPHNLKEKMENDDNITKLLAKIVKMRKDIKL